MDRHDVPPNGSESATPGPSGRSTWSERYGEKHAWHRVESFPEGIDPPRRVRVYRRADRYILQCWAPAVGKNISERVDGDLVSAIARAREIERRLEDSRSTGTGRKRLTHAELVEAYLDDLGRRADAGEIDPATVDRYRSALGHYSNFVATAEIAAKYKYAVNVDRDFVLRFRTHLQHRRVGGNGHRNATRRPMAAPQYVEDVVRGMFRWAADPDRGGLLPDSYRSPFSGRRRSNRVATLLGEPDVTVPMAAEFLAACDGFQLPLFSLHVLYGLRAAEPCLLFGEHLLDSWLDVVCLPELDYWTKGRRDKRLPLIESVSQLVRPLPSNGLLFRRRSVVEGRGPQPLYDASLDRLRREFELRCGKGDGDSRERRSLRDALLREAGGLCYDDVDAEFRRVARKLDWPREATLKDFRHLFATEMQNAGMPEHYRRYLMGLSPGRSAVLAYTHLNEIREKYETAVRARYGPVLEVLEGCTNHSRQADEGAQ